MATGRMLKKEISDSRKLGNVKTDRARVLYFMMLPHLDAAGRLEADVRLIRGQITTMLPYSERVIQSCLEQLHNANLVVLYTDSDKQYLEYTRFGDFQSLNPEREAKTKIPGPTPNNSGVIQSSPPKIRQVKLSKDKYKAFVFLTKDEYKKLITKCGKEDTKEKIADLDGYLGSTSKKYESHYLTILNWDRKNKGQKSGSGSVPKENRGKDGLTARERLKEHFGNEKG